MNPMVEIIVDNKRLECILNLLEQALQVQSPDFKIQVGQDGSFTVVPLVRFELKAQ